MSWDGFFNGILRGIGVVGGTSVGGGPKGLGFGGDPAALRRSAIAQAAARGTGSPADRAPNDPYGFVGPAVPYTGPVLKIPKVNYKLPAFDPYDTSWIYDALGKNDQTLSERQARYKAMLADPSNFVSPLNVNSVMAMGPQLWQNTQQLADQQAGLQYDPQIKAAISDRAQLGRQGKQDIADIQKWYARVNSAMQDARNSTATVNQNVADMANQGTAGIMSALGGGSNAAVGAVADTALANNSLLTALGKIQGDSLQTSQLNAQTEGAQQQTNQLRLNSQADRAAAQALAALRGQKAASAADLRMQLDSDNNSIRSSRMSTYADLVGRNKSIQAQNIATREGIQGKLDSAQNDWANANRALHGDLYGVEQTNMSTEQNLAKLRYQLQRDAMGDAASAAKAGTTYQQAVLSTILDKSGNGIGGITKKADALRQLDTQRNQLAIFDPTGQLYEGAKAAIMASKLKD